MDESVNWTKEHPWKTSNKRTGVNLKQIKHPIQICSLEQRKILVYY